MKITYEPRGINNFHNCAPLQLVVPGKKEESPEGELYVISTDQGRKIEKHFCGMKSCGCPKGAAIQLDWDSDHRPTKYGILVNWCQK